MGTKSKFIGARRTVACLVASVGFAASAGAAELDDFWALLEAPPEMPDLTWHGITLIGNIDVSAQYEQHGAPYTGGTYSPASQISPWNRTHEWLFASNQASQSYVGLKAEERLTSDLTFIARAEMGFNPTTGDISDTLKSIQRSDGVPLNQQAANGDGVRAGQILNGEAYVGFVSDPWGTLQVGRNRVVSADMIREYDPLASFGFSLFGWIGYLGGMGGAEIGRAHV